MPHAPQVWSSEPLREQFLALLLPALQHLFQTHPSCTHLVMLHAPQVWSSEPLREQFLALPLPAVRCLLASEATSVAAENTALVALAGWVEEGPAGRAATPVQRKELLSMVGFRV
jgi:hypothetical protein